MFPAVGSERQERCSYLTIVGLLQASQRCAGGIVEALEHFKLVPQ